MPRKIDAQIVEVEQSLAIGLTPTQIAADLGIALRSAARVLYRAGRADLGRLFGTGWTADRHYRAGKSCADCGGRCCDRADRCRPCYLNRGRSRSITS